MGKKGLSFRERNHARLAARKGVSSGDVVKVKSGADVYEAGERSKFWDFLIGLGIFIAASFLGVVGVIVVGVLSLIFYNKYFEGRRFVKFGMIAYFIGVVVFVLFVLYVFWSMF